MRTEQGRLQVWTAEAEKYRTEGQEVEAGGVNMPLGPHGHERYGVEVLRILCPKCGNRVSLEPGEEQAKCPKCGTTVRRPRVEKPKEAE